MRITLCAYDTSDSCGGPFVWASQFVAEMARRGARVNVLVITVGDVTESRIAARCEDVGAKVSVLDSRSAETLDEQVEWILEQWINSPTDVFIANLVLPALVAARWIRDAGAATVGIVHSNPDFDKFYRDLIDQFVLTESDWQLTACVAVSKYIADRIASECTSGADLEVIPCGAEVTHDRCRLRDDHLKLLYCGRIVQDPKRIRDVVNVFLRVTADCPQVTASIYGSGPEAAWVADALKGQTRVQYLGSLPSEKMREEMAQHHVIVLLSDYEGSPIALIEGMLCGLVPVCLSAQSWSLEVISPNRNGILVNDRNESVIAAVQSLLDDSRWAYLSQNAHDDAAQYYSYETVMQNWWELLTNLTNDREICTDRVPRSVSLMGCLNPGAFADYHPCRTIFVERGKSWLFRIRTRAQRMLGKLRSWSH